MRYFLFQWLFNAFCLLRNKLTEFSGHLVSGKVSKHNTVAAHCIICIYHMYASKSPIKLMGAYS